MKKKVARDFVYARTIENPQNDLYTKMQSRKGKKTAVRVYNEMAQQFEQAIVVERFSHVLRQRPHSGQHSSTQALEHMQKP